MQPARSRIYTSTVQQYMHAVEPCTGNVDRRTVDLYRYPPGFFAGCHARFQIMPQTRNSGFEASMLVVQYSTVLYSSYSRIRTASTVIQ